jgi:hypothetical protein
VTATFLTDEHVPSVFVTTLRSSGYEVQTTTAVLGAGTDDQQLLEYCAQHDHLLITHDKKDFSGDLGDSIDHSGVIIYTDSRFLRTDPEEAVRTLERILDNYPRSELAGERVWLDQWR